ncbi:13570_t:CDS:2 [Acaulospora colombiana]|uniref:13570_t:CDS:1 n=1 Tax=Acaulospora colombiana TaxID=27376 RepID=A0ACA9LNI2_9GLOM|nr:13570_t:CDS:2 [Acaulospora colombiana]
MSLQFHVVDAFTNRAFGGNPAAVIILPENHSYPDSLLQKIALQFNLSETAFVTPQVNSGNPESNHVTFGLRWFTPVTEVAICGHATLASASILFNNTDLIPRNINDIHFSTRQSGILIARRVVNTPKIELEFPAGDYERVDQHIHSKAQNMMIEGASLEAKDVLYVGGGKSSPYTEYLLVEIDPKIDLKSLKVNAALLASYQPKYPIVVITNQVVSEGGGLAKAFKQMYPQENPYESLKSAQGWGILRSYGMMRKEPHDFVEKPESLPKEKSISKPSAVIILPEDHGLADSTLLGIAAEFNISETAYVVVPKNKNSETDQKNGYVSLGLRWFTPTEEMPLCGHATIASSSVVFADETLIPPNINEIHFSTLSGVLKSRRIPSTPPKYELEFPTADMVPADEITLQTVQSALETASNPPVRVKHAVTSSTNPYQQYIVVEIEETTPLKGLKMNTELLGRMVPRYPLFIMCQEASNASEQQPKIQYRTFAHPFGISEDPVCGSATSFASRYWATKDFIKSQGDDKIVPVKSVSSRGGEVELVVNPNSSTVKLRGCARVASAGEVPSKRQMDMTRNREAWKPRIQHPSPFASSFYELMTTLFRMLEACRGVVWWLVRG